MKHHHPLSLGAGGHFGLGTLIFLETHRRLFGHQYGRLPRPLQDDAWAQHGYCLDAPDEMPGGGCYYDEFAKPADGEVFWVVSQHLALREAA